MGSLLPPPPPRSRRVRGPDRDATAADLAAARNVLGAHVGLRPFKDFFQRTDGRVADDVLRDFLRGEEPLQICASPPRSEGKAYDGPDGRLVSRINAFS